MEGIESQTDIAFAKAALAWIDSKSTSRHRKMVEATKMDLKELLQIAAARNVELTTMSHAWTKDVGDRDLIAELSTHRRDEPESHPEEDFELLLWSDGSFDHEVLLRGSKR